MKLYDMMNQYLADQEVFYIKVRNMHYNVKGDNFFSMHVKLEELYGATEDIIDEVAERLKTLGQRPISNMKNALNITKIKELADEPIDCAAAAKEVVKDLQYSAKSALEISDAAEEANDPVTADMFNAYIQAHDKDIWMYTAYLGEEVKK